MVFQVPEEELEACPLPEWVFLLVTVKEDFAVWETDVRAAAWVGRVPVRSVQDRQRHAARVLRFFLFLLGSSFFGSFTYYYILYEI